MIAIAAWCLGFALAASGALPQWIVNVESQSALEGAFFRWMEMPGGAVLGRRPPSETRPALADLIKSKPNDGVLYSLRALEEEQQLEFDAAEQDWKQFTQQAQDQGAANLALADFYHRRARPLDEIKALAIVGQMPPAPGETLAMPSQQRSWKAFDRIFRVAQAQAVTKDVTAAQYRAWIARYPRERSLYVRYFQNLLDQKDAASAQQAIVEYQKAFPEDALFPVKAKALVSSKQSVEQGLAVYDQAFQPLWPPELVRNFFNLLKETRSTRQYLDKWRGQLEANPDDVNTLARTFFYYQQQGKVDVAQQVITEYRLRKEARQGQWSAEELSTLARLLEQVHAYVEASRYYYALYNAQAPDAKEKALAGLTSILLTAPEQPLRLGAGELSIYQDITTLDTGPGFLNGILSLILNTTNPATQFSQEEQRAVPYFNRAQAAELLAAFDAAFPNSARRPELHAQLLETYANYGASDAVVRDGEEYLANFPDGSQRTQVSLLMADAYARTKQTREEFAIYDAVLQELARKAQQVPLGAAANELGPDAGRAALEAGEGEAEGEGQCEDCGQPKPRARLPRKAQPQAFAVAQAGAEQAQSGPRSPEYARVLERYIGRLVQQKQVTEALGVLRRELDRNPNDPGLYERLAAFLQQNQIGAETEQVYKRAIQQFQDRSWYHKLARWYLAQRRRSDFAQLSADVVKIFAGTELQSYFEAVVRWDAQTGPQLYLQLNLYAHQRFPHNLTFVRNLLAAYSRRETREAAAYDRLLREHWMEADDLRNLLFQSLAGPKLEAELREVETANVAAGNWDAAASKNPVAVRFVADAHLWRSHFEEAAAPLAAVARVFPADFEIGRSASAVYRSLAYFDARNTDLAVAVEQNLLQADPGNRETLARIGDIYADRELFAQAAPFWEKIPATAPGADTSYLDAATIYWDYFDFDNALRLLNQGRAQFGRPELYSYEEGAIYESKRAYPQAVTEYVKGALATEEMSPSQTRLLQLATRPNYRELVEAATVTPTEQPNPPPQAVNLRIALLEAQNRKDDLEKFLVRLVEQATALDLLESLEQLAQQKSIESARRRALERQAELTTDPIRRLELRYALVRFYENKKDFAAAQRNLEELYRENPKVLGIVRATVDFYWRTKQQQRAIDVLMQASKNAYPDLGKRFSFEAARKMIVAGQYEPARQIIRPLLAEQPYNSEYLAAMADTYARAGDHDGLRNFYLEKIALFQTAAIEATQKTSQIAALRRGLIPALTRLKDYAGAVDQYQLILNSYPEDDGLTTEAAFYAARHDLKQRLLDVYARAVQRSPRDPRWAIVLARLLSNFEDYPAAVEVYGQAIAVRPDRVDLRIARAGLLERLMRFDEAAADYAKLYELAYKDPSWMEKVAGVRARQGRTADVVSALKLALIEGRPEQPENYFNVAQRLEQWNLLAPAREFADLGMKAAGDTALNRDLRGVKLWTRIMTRERKHDEAWTRLDAIRSAVDASASSALARPALANSDEDMVKRSGEAARRIQARTALTACLQEMGATIDKYFVSEERARFATYLAQRRAGMELRDLNDFLVPLAQSAGIPELEAQWRQVLLLGGADPANSSLNRLAELQTARLKFNELGAQMEALAARAAGTPIRRPQDMAATYLQRAAGAYRAGQNWQAELRVLGTLYARNQIGDRQRYYALLMEHDPQTLLGIAANATAAERDQVGNFVLAHGDNRASQQAVEMRSRGLAPVWLKAYAALTGLYFRDASPAVDTAFRSALSEATIGERLGKTVDRAQYLAGDIWFYYGGRYGEYLGSVTRRPSADDYLPSPLEQTPGRAAAYETLAEYYNDSGDAANAIADYNHSLELGPERPDIHDKLAVIDWRQNNRAAAAAHWREALAILTRQVSRRQVPETFWRHFGAIMDHLATRKILGEHHREVDALLRAYVRKNGTWRNTTLMRDAYRALGDDAAGIAWLLDLASAAPNPAAMITEFAGHRWIPASRKEPIYQRLLQFKQEAVAHAQGMERDYAVQDLRTWQRRWIDFLLDTSQFDRARNELGVIRADTGDVELFVQERLRLDAAQNRLAATLESYRADPDHAPPLALLRDVATDLQKRKDAASAREILEYVFSREIEEHKLSAANLLGLAEIRIQAGDLKGALELLHRAALVVGQPFENLDAAASLLVRTGHPAEATEFYDALVKAEPWNAEARVSLAQAQLKAGKDAAGARAALIAIARDAGLVYETRLRAAVAAAPSNEMVLGSNELRVIASNLPVIPPVMNPAFFYQARIKAAEQASSNPLRLRLLGAAIEDFPSRDAARIPFFRAALDAGQNQLAIEAIQPLMRSVFAWLRGSRAGGEASDTAEEQMPATQPGWNKVPQAERASIARAIATALDSLDRWPEAMRFFNVAADLETVPEKKAAVQRQIQDLRARMRRRAQNDARRPMIHQELEQDRVVRPMLVARSAPPVAPAKARRTP